MNLSEMITMVRNNLKDEITPYQWSDDELTRHINHALRELSERTPLPAEAILPTISTSRAVDISSLTERIMVQAVEYPLGAFPTQYQRFSIWGDVLVIISGDTPNGTNCRIYYGVLHTIDTNSSTVPTKYEDLVVTGACGYAVISQAVASINRVNVGGEMTADQYRSWGEERLTAFRDSLKRLGRRQQLRDHQLFID
ncbi:MAG: hypothetical protein J7K77_04715 [Dehalococcoidales bacterium]|nr:hypothetical protein [Dehalococcoidales bacterium]